MNKFFEILKNNVLKAINLEEKKMSLLPLEQHE